MLTIRSLPFLALAALALSAPALADGPKSQSAGARQTTTDLISRSVDGGTPNGASTKAVISGDRRYARLIAFESEASDLVRGDTNGQKDLFAIERAGSFGNNGSAWRAGDTTLVSRGLAGAPADGPSFGASVSGDFRHDASCVAFLSAATNLAAGDINGKVDAFMVEKVGDAPTRVSPDDIPADADSVSVSGDCSRVSFTAGGRLYTSVRGGAAKAVSTSGPAKDVSYAAGNSNALVYGASRGVWLSSNGTSRGKLVVRGGRNPAMNDIKRRTLVYEKTIRGRSQIGYRDLGKRERIISSRKGRRGNRPSRNPTVANSGFFAIFESDATNLSISPANNTGDRNRRPDSYLFTDSRDITILESVERNGVPLPGGGANPSMSFYANYFVFDSPAPLGAQGQHQIFLRYVGGI